MMLITHMLVSIQKGAVREDAWKCDCCERSRGAKNAHSGNLKIIAVKRTEVAGESLSLAANGLSLGTGCAGGHFVEGVGLNVEAVVVRCEERACVAQTE